MKKNNLDDLFREKLGDFQEVPDNSVWEKIVASLDKKRKKRVSPIWWQLGGAAALLAILLYVINPFELEKQTDLPVVETGDGNTNSQIEDNNNPADKILDRVDTDSDSQVVDNQPSETDTSKGLCHDKAHSRQSGLDRK